MAFDLHAIEAAVAAHGSVARIVVTDTKGSAPRDSGTSMLVWSDGQSGTIGGGTLEFEAVEAAQQLLTTNETWARTARTIPLGPALGQCCGGSVSLLSEVFTASEFTALSENEIFARPLRSGNTQTNIEPLSVKRLITQARAQGTPPAPTTLDGWFIEPMKATKTPLWIYGAGHVGRALVHTLAPLDFDITWVDTDASRYPATIPDDVTQLCAENPASVAAYAPANAQHLILTFSHALDLELCHQLLGHSFASVGLIGSKSKWARFQSRLRALGHTDTQIQRITCPIGDPTLGKSPQAIAVGVAAKLLSPRYAQESAKDVAT